MSGLSSAPAPAMTGTITYRSLVKGRSSPMNDAHERDRHHPRRRAQGDEQGAEPPLRVGGHERQQPGHGAGDGHRDRRRSERRPLGEIEHDPEHEAEQRTAFAATGHTGRGGGDHHDLDHDAGDLVVDEQRPLDGEQDMPTGMIRRSGPWTSAASTRATTCSTSDNGL